MEPLFFEQVRCPYCGEFIPLRLDGSAGDQSYVEDCSVCCQPMLVTLRVDDDGGLTEVVVRREAD